MKKTLILFYLLFVVGFVFADESISPHSLSISLGGPQSYGYFEYQYRISESPKGNVSLSAGMGMQSSQLALPIGLVYTFGQKSQFILGFHYVPQLGRRYMYMWEFVNYSPDLNLFNFQSLSLRVGYRKIFKIKNEYFFMQGYFSPVIDLGNEEITIYPSVGLGLGVFL